jgi:hypothetical protein
VFGIDQSLQFIFPFVPSVSYLLNMHLRLFIDAQGISVTARFPVLDCHLAKSKICSLAGHDMQFCELQDGGWNSFVTC